MTTARFALLSVLLLAGPLATALWAVQFQSTSRAEASEHALRTAMAAQTTIESGLSLVAANAAQVTALLANDPRFLLALSTRPLDAATVQDALEESGINGAVAVAVFGTTGERLAQTPNFVTPGGQLSDAQRLVVRDNRALVVSSARISRGATTFGTMMTVVAVPASLFVDAASAIKGSAGLSKEGLWAGSQPSSGAPTIGRVLAAWPDTRVEVTIPPAAEPPQPWVPLVVVCVTSIGWVLLTWLFIRRKS